MPVNARCVLGYNPVSDRIISVRLQASLVNISFIQVYAPTSTANEEIGSFDHELQETINKIPRRDITLIWVISTLKSVMAWKAMMLLGNLD